MRRGEIPEIFESEYRICLIVWEQEPVNSTRLVALAADQLGWRKPTTYTVPRLILEKTPKRGICLLWLLVFLRRCSSAFRAIRGEALKDRRNCGIMHS